MLSTIKCHFEGATKISGNLTKYCKAYDTEIILYTGRLYMRGGGGFRSRKIRSAENSVHGKLGPRKLGPRKFDTRKTRSAEKYGQRKLGTLENWVLENWVPENSVPVPNTNT